MKTIIVCLLLVMSVSYLNGCGGSMDRTWDGRPKFDINGNKVGGDDLYMEELMLYKVILATIKSLNDTNSRSSNNGQVPPGWLNGYFINRSNTDFIISIYTNSNKETRLFSGLVYKKSYLETFLPPGIEFYAEFDNGKGYQIFNVLMSEPTVCQIGPTLQLNGYYYFIKKP